MPRPPIPLEEHRELVLELSSNSITISEIHRILRDEHNIRIGLRTLKNRLQAWQITKNTRSNTSEQLRDRIKDLCLLRQSDKNILRILTSEGQTVNISSLIRIRKKLGLKKRVELEDREIADQEILPIVRAELQKGLIEGYGRDMLQAHFWEQGHLISRYPILFICFFIY